MPLYECRRWGDGELRLQRQLGEAQPDPPLAHSALFSSLLPQLSMTSYSLTLLLCLI